MTDYNTCRIACYVVTILVHTSNMMYMAASVNRLKDDPELKDFLQFQPRYFTGWNSVLQLIYAIIALVCEVLMLRNSGNKDYRLNKHLNGLRNILFSGVIWPCTMLVFSLFWSLYLLDRELVFPKFADKAITPLSNHIIHTFIMPIVLWDVVFRPRVPPKSHKRNLYHLFIHLILYLCVLVYTYIQSGIWIYPIFNKLYGSVFFPVSILTIVLMSIAYYYLQWTLTVFIWGRSPLKKIK